LRHEPPLRANGYTQYLNQSRLQIDPIGVRVPQAKAAAIVATTAKARPAEIVPVAIVTTWDSIDIPRTPNGRMRLAHRAHGAYPLNDAALSKRRNRSPVIAEFG
jgi:hypothetical protein